MFNIAEDLIDLDVRRSMHALTPSMFGFPRVVRFEWLGLFVLVTDGSCRTSRTHPECP